MTEIKIQIHANSNSFHSVRQHTYPESRHLSYNNIHSTCRALVKKRRASSSNGDDTTHALVVLTAPSVFPSTAGDVDIRIAILNMDVVQIIIRFVPSACMTRLNTKPILGTSNRRLPVLPIILFMRLAIYRNNSAVMEAGSVLREYLDLRRRNHFSVHA